MKKTIFIFLILIAILVFPGLAAQASSFSQGLEATGSQVQGLQSDPPEILAAQIIKIMLGLIGIIFVILVIYAGFTYMTSQGEETKIKKAKITLTASVIGIIIIISAYSITNFIVTKVASPGSEIPPYNQACEFDTLETHSQYVSIPCCIYRYRVYGNVSDACCRQTQFCRYNSEVTEKCGAMGVSCN